MTVKEYVEKHQLDEFYCCSDLDICIKYRYKSARKWVETEQVHGAINLCHRLGWEKYKSYKRFANREIKKVDGKNIYTKWTVGEILREFELLSPGSQIIDIIWIVDRVNNKTIKDSSN